MARRIGSDSTVSDTSESTDSVDLNDQSQEDSNMSTETVAEATEESTTPVVEAAAETTTESTDSAPEAAAPEAKPEVDLSEFEAAVQAAIDSRDPSTGTVPEAQADAVKTAYQALSVGGKSKSKTHLLNVMTAGVEGGDLSTAMAASQLQKVLVPKASGSSKPKEEKAPADPNEAVATQLAILRTAFVYLQDNLPEGAELEAVKAKTAELGTTAGEQLAGYLEWLGRDEPAEGTEDAAEPDVSTVTKKAAKLVLTKVRVATSGGGGSSYSGPRRSVSTHITQVFEGKASGDFMSIAEIANASSEEYGSDKVSSGAVTARLFPTEGECSLTDVKPGTQDGKRGAIKL